MKGCARRICCLETIRYCFRKAWMPRQAAAQGFDEHHTVQLDNNTDWNALFSLCQAMSLFARQTIQILLPENGPNAAINEQLATLVSLLHSDLLLIVRGNKLTKAQENAAWFTQLAAHAVLVTCQTPEQAHLPKWVAARANSTICSWMMRPISCCATATKVTCWRWRRRWTDSPAVAGWQTDAAAR
jgi:hypothetical protein